MTGTIKRADIAILVTGGTLDKVHNTVTETLDFTQDVQTHITHVLKTGRCFYPRVEVLFKMDSLEMTDAHRRQVLGRINAAKEQHIIVTHGTGTLEQTAKFLSGKTAYKTIVLTGAMRPVSLGQSDGSFNLGGALIAAQLLPKGVYGVMNGRVFNAENLHKNIELGRFDI